MLVGHQQCGQGEHDGDQRLAHELLPPREAEAALSADLGVVVEESDQAESDEQEEHEQGAEGDTAVDHLERPGGAQELEDRVRAEVAGEGCRDDDDATHGGLSPLDVVVGEVVVDELTPASPDQERDERFRAQQCHCHGDATSKQDVDHQSSSLPSHPRSAVAAPPGWPATGPVGSDQVAGQP